MKKWKIVLPVLLAVALVCLCLLLFLGGKEYTVSFLNEDGTQIHTATYSKGEQLIVPEDPEKEGHSFVGWALNGEKEAYDFSTEGAKTVAQDMEFVALFAPNSYTVKFVASNGKDVITSESYLYGENFVVPEAPALTGHSFIGWVKQGETAVSDFNADSAKSTKGNVVYVAKYEPVKSKITFTDHDGSVLNEKTYTYAEFFTVPEDPVREGYVFLGWGIAGQTGLYDFEAKDAKRVGESDTVFVAIYDKLEIVAGKLVKVGGAAFPAKVTISFGEYVRTVAVAADGSFTTQLPVGKYKVSVALDGYNCLVDTVTVVAGGCHIGEVKLQQTVAKDNAWWNGGEVSVNGTSATVTVKDGDFNKGDSGIEYQIGSPITGADSWKISAHIANGATGMRGFSAGLNDKGQTLFIYVTDTETGFYSWGTVMDSSAAKETRQRGWPLSEEAKKAIAADDGYQLTLVATNIDGAGTGWLTMYVNDIAVLQIENTFVGSGDRSTAGEKVNLSNVDLCLAARTTGNTVTYTDCYYVTDAESALKIGTISGKLTKQDGVAMPKYAVVTNGVTYRTIPVAADGSFVATVPAGEYRITAEGYTSVDDSISVTAEKNELGEVKLRQTISSSMSWWGGGSIVENGSSATITMPDGEGVSVDVGHEFQIGTSFTGSTSWKATTHVAKGAVERRGFSFGTANGKNGTLFVYVDDYNAGFSTWNTFQNEAGENHSWNHPLSSAVKEAMAAEDGYDLTLVATNIDGEGTGWLILYVNDLPVLALENTFVSIPGNHIDENVVMDLGKGHISLVMHKNGASATFSDYSYVVNQEKDLEIGTASGSIAMMDGSKIPEEVRFSDGLFSKTVKVNADGTFTIVIPTGEYRITSEGYKDTVDGIVIVEGTKDLGKIIMQQVLTPDPMTWWNGSSYTESGSSVTITANPGNSNSMKEFNLGSPILNADSWRISATIQPGATYRRGFTIAPAGADKHDEMIFIWVEDGTAGFLTWGTFKDENGKDAVWDYSFDSTLTQGAYELTLIATNFDGAGTGWLSLYVNDTLVMQMENTFVGTGDRTEAGDMIDLGNVVLSLAALGQGNTVTFSDYCYVTNNETDLKLGTISAEAVKLDGTTAPNTVKLTGGKVRKTVKVNTDGTFNATVPVGEYSITADGYRGAVDSIAVAEGTKDLGQISLLQCLSDGGSWWGGGALTESNNSAVITLPATGNANIGHEYQIGDPITDATSWKVSAHIAKGSTGRRGFSVAPVNARNAETLFLWIEDGTAGFFTWSTYADENGNMLAWDYTFDDAVKAATANANGYDLTLVATNIDGTGTGWLTMYVNDIAVMQIENTFVGTGDRTEVGDKIDLGNVVVSLAATNPGNTVTFSDYYYVVDQEQDLVISTVSGELIKLDNCAMPESIVLSNSILKKPVSVTNGEFTVKLPLGTYQLKADSHRSVAGDLVVDDETEDLGQIKLLQTLTQSGSWWAGGMLSENGNHATITVKPGNGDSGVEYQIGKTITNAESWRVSTHIAKGATGRRGFSIAPVNARNGETVFIWIEDGTAGFYTWNTYADENGAPLVWNYSFNSAVQSATANANGYDLTLVATNIDGAGTGWLSLYVNDMLVMQIENTFTGTGDRTQAGDKIDLGNVVVSLAAYSPNNAVTFSDYYYRVNEETDLTVGTVSGKVTKLDGTAIPNKLSLTAGKIRKTVKVNADGTFSVTLPVGTYNIGAVEGYRGSISTITVAEGNNANVELKLLQNLTTSVTWWGGGSKTENGNSVTITLNQTTEWYNYDIGHEYQIGPNVTNATSWKVSAKVTKNSNTCQSGFSFGPSNAKNGMLLFYVNAENAGLYTWDTFKNGNAQSAFTVALSDAAKAAVASADGYTLTLVAEGINGPHTGYLALYVNDIPVLVLENTFTSVSCGHTGNVTVPLDLGDGHISLAVRYGGSSATYTDYYMQTNCNTPLTLGTVTGNVVKLDGTAIPSTLKLSAGQINKVVSVNTDGTFSATLPVGAYNLAITADGYRCAVNSAEVTEGTKDIGDVKLLQTLTLDGGWWAGGSYTESGNSATLTVSPYNNNNAHGDSGREVKVGSTITGAISWEIGAHINDNIAANYEARRGFSVGVNGTGATLFVFVDNLGYVGWYSWDTLEHTDYDATAYPHYQLQRYAMDATSAAAVKSGSFDMKLVATGINGAGTGMLTLYINDVKVLQFENKFEGHGGRLGKDVVVDLSQAALCLAVRRSGTVTTFSDYYTTYIAN